MAAGVWYDFLRPVKGAKRDLLFLPGLIYAWLQLTFGVCRGDLRMAHLAGMGLGFLLWEKHIWHSPAACIFHDLENLPVFMAAREKNFRKFAEI